MTEESFKALKSFAGVATLPSPIKSEVVRNLTFARPAIVGKPRFSRVEILAKLKQIPKYDQAFPGVAGNKDFVSSAIAMLGGTDLDVIREARRKSITGVSDEALDEFGALSEILAGVINKLDLYKESRIHP